MGGVPGKATPSQHAQAPVTRECGTPSFLLKDNRSVLLGSFDRGNLKLGQLKEMEAKLQETKSKACESARRSWRSWSL